MGLRMDRHCTSAEVRRAPTVPRSENAPKDTISMVLSKTHANAAVDVSAFERRPCIDGPPPVHRSRRANHRVPFCLPNTGQILSVDKESETPDLTFAKD